MYKKVARLHGWPLVTVAALGVLALVMALLALRIPARIARSRAQAAALASPGSIR